ncbi:hypothetical protein PFUGPA_05997 [Plasmodium falciparum Palo Alto/Uganda]|uniref:Uncharacterized protein n=1 Tax=Plasmodium falciparum (isolate Palo Alto / Uganda) TaxID=57270 RepID=W4IQL1_PLAFP|nr:hypothetical protein PFUGPA_05997 [Plasmodium falciparum Palo Alto/Uganda]
MEVVLCMWCNSPMFYIPMFLSPLYPKISTQNCMHIRGSKCGCTHSTNICPYSKYLWIYISHLIWDMLGHFMYQKRHHFYHLTSLCDVVLDVPSIITTNLLLHYYYFTTTILVVYYYYHSTTSLLLTWWYITTTLVLLYYY